MTEFDRNPFQDAFRQIVAEYKGAVMDPGDPKLLSRFSLHCLAAPNLGPLHLRIFSFSDQACAEAAFAKVPQTDLGLPLLWDPHESVRLRDIWNVWADDCVVDQNKTYDAEFFGAQRERLLSCSWIEAGSIPTGPDAQPIFVTRFDDPRDEPPAKAALCLLGIRAQTKLADYSIGALFRKEQAGEDLSKEPRHLMITETHLRALKRF